jgi:hypothetical protein
MTFGFDSHSGWHRYHLRSQAEAYYGLTVNPNPCKGSGEIYMTDHDVYNHGLATSDTVVLFLISNKKHSNGCDFIFPYSHSNEN